MAIATGTALLIGAGVSAVGSMMAASKQAKGAKQAAAISAEAGETARADLAPWRNVGESALYEMSALMGLPGEYPGGGGPMIDQQGRPVQNGMAPPWGGGQAGNAGAQYGRGGDNRMAHVTPGETVVPESVASQLPGGRDSLNRAFRENGMTPNRYIVGGGGDSYNPVTKMPEFYPASGMDDPGDKAGGFAESGGFGAGDFGDPSGNYGQGPESQNVDNRDGGRNAFNRFDGGGGYNAPAPAQNQMTLPEDYYGQENAMARFQTSPGYEFRLGEGVRALEHSAAARGNLFSGNQMRAITEYGQNYAAGEYGDYWNRLAALAGGGQASAAGQANIGMQTAANVGNSMYGAAQAGAQGIAGVGSGINTGINNYLFYQAMQNGAFG